MLFLKIVLILGFFVLLSFNAYGQKNETSLLFGHVVYPPDKRGDYAIPAVGVIIEIQRKKKLIKIISNEAGLIVEYLPKGKYCLLSAKTAEGSLLKFRSDQHKCFEIKSKQDIRFDVVVLKPTFSSTK